MFVLIIINGRRQVGLICDPGGFSNCWTELCVHCVYLYILGTLFSTRTSDRGQMWHSCADRDETGSHLKQFDPPHPIYL